MDGRLVELTQLLLRAKEEITISEISRKMGVSGRTVRNYLDKIELTLSDNGLKLNKTPGVGISLQGSQSDKQRFSELLSSSTYDDNIPPQHRQETILITILMNSNKYNVEKLAQRLYVSPSTVYKDMSEIDKLLNEQDLLLVNNSGRLSVEGDEKNIRKILSNFIIKTKLNLVDVEDINDISDSTFGWVENNFGFNHGTIEKFVVELEEILNTKFSEDIFTSLILHISVSLYRIQQGKTVELPDKIRESVVKLPDYEIVKECALKFYKKFNLEITEQEIVYITLHISTNKNYASMSAYKDLFGKDEYIDLSMAVAKEIASISSKSLDLNLNNDEIFLNSLVLHLIPTITRLKSNLSLKNPILDEIKSKYTETYGLAWMSSLIVEKNLGVRIPESEIGFIAIHIGAAIERNKSKIKTKVISNSGYGTIQFIKQKLKREFSELEIVDDITDVNDVDLIINTTSDNQMNLISISPMVLESDIENVKNFIDDFYMSDTPARSIHKKLYFNDSSLNKQDILEKMCRYVESKGYVSEKYMRTVFEREEVLSTEVGNLVTIPHGATEEVKESSIVLSVLRNEIDWNKSKVKFVFLVCLSEEDLDLGKTIFSNLSNTMSLPNFYNNLKENENTAQRELDKLFII